MRHLTLAVFAICALAIAACSGTQTIYAPPAPTPTASTPTASTKGTVSFLFVVPPASTTSARSRNVVLPSSAQSVTIAIDSVNGTSQSGTPTTVNLTASTSGCQASSAGLSCVANISAPSGTVIFTVTAYSGANGGGTSLGSGNLSVSVTAGATASAPVTLTGTIAKIVLAVGSAAEYGNAGTYPVTIQAEDASGNTIVGTYGTAIALTDTDASGATSLSATSVADSTSAASVTLSYTGAAMSSAASIGASAGGVSATPATFLPDANNPTTLQNTVQFTLVEYEGSVTNATPAPPLNLNGTYPEGSAVSPASFNGITNAYSVENDLSGDYGYYAWLPSGSASDWSYLGQNGEGGLQTCQAPYATEWIVPLPSTNTSWNAYAGTGPCSESSSNYDGPTQYDNSSMTLNGDGSYSASQSYNETLCCGPTADGATSATVASSGAATLSESQDGGESAYFSAPAPSGPTSTVQLYENPSSTLPPSPVPTSTSAPNPYDVFSQAGVPGLSGGTLPNTLQSDTYTPKGPVALPTACAGVASIVGSNPIIEVDENYTSIDPLVYNGSWYYNNVSQGYYLNGVGLVCVVSTSLEIEPIAEVYRWYDGTQQNYQSWSYYGVTYITATSLTAMMKQRQSFAKALPATTALLQSFVHERMLQRSRAHSTMAKRAALRSHATR